jgi:polyhydroxyalkanoate synthesis regulator phasin
MNPDTLIQTLQKGYRVTIGATASVIESLQDSQSREENFAKLRSDPNQLIEELAIKGETTEREARSFVDGVFSQSNSSQQSNGTPTYETSAPLPPRTAVIQQELQELTAQLAAIRTELERLRA